MKELQNKNKRSGVQTLVDDLLSNARRSSGLERSIALTIVGINGIFLFLS